MSVAIEQMLDNLRTLTEVEELAFDEGGRLELLFDNEMPIDIVKLSEDRVVLVSPIHSSPETLNFEELSEYLQGNYFGDATGHGAIVYDFKNNQLILKDEFEPALFDMKRLEARIIDFVRYASFWSSDRSERMAEAPEEEKKPEFNSEEFFIRG